MGWEDLVCGVCGLAPETTLHLFNDCAGLRAFAYGSIWGGKLEAWREIFVFDLVEACMDPQPLLWEGFDAKKKKKIVLFSLWILCIAFGGLEMKRSLK